MQVSGTALSSHVVYWKCFTSLLSLFCQEKEGGIITIWPPSTMTGFMFSGISSIASYFLFWYYYSLMHNMLYCTIILLLFPRWTNVLWSLPRFLPWQLARWCLRTSPHPCQASTDGKSPVQQHGNSWMIHEVALNKRELHQCICIEHKICTETCQTR